jgi:quinol monooxygenase YgiN
MTHTVSIVLNIAADKADDFEQAFRANEYPVWEDLRARGILLRASLSPLHISTVTAEGCKQYLVLAQFEDPSGHHVHDDHPGFKAWNEMAEKYQPKEPFVFGGNSLCEIG